MEVTVMKSASTTSKMLIHTKKALTDSLSKKYNIEDEDVVNNMLKIHGLHRDNFDFIKSIEKVMNERINDVSIDSSGNKGEKSIEGICQESVNPVKKAIGFDYLFRVMKDLYGKDEANRLLGEMLDLSVGLSDATQIMKPYCWSMDANHLVLVGKQFGQLRSGPAENISEYIAMLCETIHELASHVAGALAMGSLFLDLAFVLIYKEKIHLDSLHNEKPRINGELNQLIYSVNNLSRSHTESPFTNVSIFDTVKLKALVEDKKSFFCYDGSEMTEERLNYIVDYVMAIQLMFLEIFDEGDPLSGGAPFRFPVVTMNLSKSDDGESVLDENFLRLICDREIYKYNIFVSKGSKVASCCRLVSDAEMLDYASSVNSFSGASISLGSHRVCTINLARIAIESNSEKEFVNLLESRIESTAKILKAHKHLIKILTDKGLQPFITNGWINPNRLFSTFGIIGINECVEIYKEKFGNGRDIIGEVLSNINSKVNSISKEYGIIGNIEQIPGESFAIRLVNADKMIFGENKASWVMYSNQFIPLWQEASIWDKMDIDGRYNKLITGGGIVHAQIGEKVTGKQAEKIIKYAVKTGCEHFALNSVYSKCDNGHVTFGKHKTCIICGGEIIDYFTRIVGYFTPVSNWHKDRREWEFPRRTFAEIYKK